MMRAAVMNWELYTGKSKILLAKESGLWKVHLEKRGVYRTRTLDRYLYEATFPEHPRWNKVFETVRFVLKVLPENTESGYLHDRYSAMLDLLELVSENTE